MLPVRLLPAGRRRPIPPGVRRRLPAAAWSALRADGIPRRHRTPLRARVSGGRAARARGATPTAHDLPLHVHADEQPREIEECVAESGMRPIELLDTWAASARGRRSCTPPTPTAHELDLLAAAGARICVCPTTESNLGDGFLRSPCPAPRNRPVHRQRLERRIDPLEELRELEGIARRQTGKRGVISLDALLGAGTDEGAAALGLDDWPDATRPPGARATARRRRGGGLRRAWFSAARATCCGRHPTSSGSASRYALAAARPWRPHAPSYER